jgi:hypothetical protein
VREVDAATADDGDWCDGLAVEVPHKAVCFAAFGAVKG